MWKAAITAAILATFFCVPADAAKAKAQNTYDEGLYVNPAEYLEQREQYNQVEEHQQQEQYGQERQGATQRQGQSFLEVSASEAAGLESMLSQLATAVKAQSQAMTALQRQQAKLESHKVAFAAREASAFEKITRRLAPPLCKEFIPFMPFSAPPVSAVPGDFVDPVSGKEPIHDESTCKAACKQAFETSTGRWKKQRSGGGGACECLRRDGGTMLCTDGSTRTSASVMTVLVVLYAFLQM